MRLRALSNPRLEAMTFIVSRLSVGSVLPLIVRQVNVNVVLCSACRIGKLAQRIGFARFIKKEPDTSANRVCGKRYRMD